MDAEQRAEMNKKRTKLWSDPFSFLTPFPPFQLQTGADEATRGECPLRFLRLLPEDGCAFLRALARDSGQKWTRTNQGCQSAIRRRKASEEGVESELGISTQR
jgi:hypothetical protein